MKLGIHFNIPEETARPLMPTPRDILVDNPWILGIIRHQLDRIGMEVTECQVTVPMPFYRDWPEDRSFAGMPVRPSPVLHDTTFCIQPAFDPADAKRIYQPFYFIEGNDQIEMTDQGPLGIEPMDKVKDIAHVFALLGTLHQEQAELFLERGIALNLPGFDLEDYIVDMVRLHEDDTVKTIGCILCKQSGCFDNTYTIADIVLYKEYRGRGLGERALRNIMTRMQEDGVKFVNLNVHADNEAARKLYEKLGFQATSLHMTKELT